MKRRWGQRVLDGLAGDRVGGGLKTLFRISEPDLLEMDVSVAMIP
jgi:hypothetical protein